MPEFPDPMPNRFPFGLVNPTAGSAGTFPKGLIESLRQFDEA
jgi:hypothetical protein